MSPETELERLRNYQRNANRLISRAQDMLTVDHPVFWVLDDLDDSYYGPLPDSHFEEL